MPLVDGEFKPIDLPPKHARVLFDRTRPWRYRVLYGGRNGGKDWAMATAAIELAVRRPMRILCTREIQNTIRDSIHQLLADTIRRLGYGDYFRVSETDITGTRNDTRIIFRGLKDMTAENLKSLEGIDLVVVGEAQSLSKKSFTVLDPTIRKPGSEIWIQFNTQDEDDFVYQFCVVNPPENMICERVNYTDNPWTSAEMTAMAERMRLEDERMYRNVWLGEPHGKGGRVFPMYDPEIHLIDFDYAYLPMCNRYMAIDPHRKYYPAIKWYAITPTAATVVYNEWPRYEDLGMWYDEARNVRTFDMSIKELANIILANDLTVQYPGGLPVVRTGDPRFLAENPDFVRALMENGVMGWRDAPFQKIETQRENLKSLINWNPALPLAGINAPEWYVDKRCRNSDRAYRRHCWSDEKDKEREENKDFIDADRYFLSVVDGRPRYTEHELPGGAGGGRLVSLSEHLKKKSVVAV